MEGEKNLDGSIIVSAIALLVSILNAGYTYRQNENHHINNIQIKYFEKVFDDHLLIHLPQARRYLRFDNNGRLTDVEILSSALNDLRQSALYFMYTNHKFYDKLRNNIKDLDDYIQKCGNASWDSDQQVNVLNQIHKKMEAIYNCINDTKKCTT